MENCLKFYIDGAWVEPSDPKPFDVINPANEQVIGQIMLGNENDVNKAVAAAKKAFFEFFALFGSGASRTSGCHYRGLSKSY